MNIIHIDEKSYSQLMTWKAENHELIKAVSPYSRYYFEKVQVNFEFILIRIMANCL